MEELFKTLVKGHVLIKDETTGEILVDCQNAIHYENFSIAIAQSLGAGPLNVTTAPGFFYAMAFGNGGTSVSATGIVTYNPPNNVGISASLYNQTYSKVINNNFAADPDIVNNNIAVNHVTGKAYTDILVTCMLDYGEPADQQAFDNTTDFTGPYVFDELGIVGPTGQLLTHVIFNPIQKSLNRLISISYTVRIQTLTNLQPSS